MKAASSNGCFLTLRGWSRTTTNRPISVDLSSSPLTSVGEPMGPGSFCWASYIILWVKANRIYPFWDGNATLLWSSLQFFLVYRFYDVYWCRMYQNWWEQHPASTLWVSDSGSLFCFFCSSLIFQTTFFMQILQFFPLEPLLEHFSLVPSQGPATLAAVSGDGGGSSKTSIACHWLSFFFKMSVVECEVCQAMSTSWMMVGTVVVCMFDTPSGFHLHFKKLLAL